MVASRVCLEAYVCELIENLSTQCIKKNLFYIYLKLLGFQAMYPRNISFQVKSETVCLLE